MPRPTPARRSPKRVLVRAAVTVATTTADASESDVYAGQEAVGMVVHELCEKEIAADAAHVDEHARYPVEALGSNRAPRSGQ
jgi:hypothetical protein